MKRCLRVWLSNGNVLVTEVLNGYFDVFHGTLILYASTNEYGGPERFRAFAPGEWKTVSSEKMP